MKTITLVFSTETLHPELLGELLPPAPDDEGIVRYVHAPGEYGIAPEDCVALLRVDISHLPHAS